MPLSCECCVLSCRGLCDPQITGPKTYRVWRVECAREAAMRRTWPTWVSCAGVGVGGRVGWGFAPLISLAN
jgi:hypothetical protein